MLYSGHLGRKFPILSLIAHLKDLIPKMFHLQLRACVRACVCV